MPEEELLEEINPTEKRIKDLSEKVRLTATERDEQKALLEKERSEKQTLSKEMDFLNSFTDISGKYPESSSFKDKIKEKVFKGYSVEDATISTLASEGKYTPPKAPVHVENHVGGSAVTQPMTGGEKSLGELSQGEKRQKLVDLERGWKSGTLNS